jgi:hypothetical protein
VQTTKPSQANPVQLTAVSPALATTYFDGKGRIWLSRQMLASDSKRHTGRSNTQHTELSCPIHKNPSANDGQYQIDGNHTLSFRIFMHTSNLNFQVHITISKSDIQCSQTVHL